MWIPRWYKLIIARQELEDARRTIDALKRDFKKMDEANEFAWKEIDKLRRQLLESGVV
jgi:hypothetical protein